jgi:hypothetical protein
MQPEWVASQLIAEPAVQTSKRSILLQPWTTIRVSEGLVDFTQGDEGWVDMSGYSDVAFWIDVSDVFGGPVQLTLQTAPSADEELFSPLTQPLLLAAQAGPTVMSSISRIGNTGNSLSTTGMAALAQLVR